MVKRLKDIAAGSSDSKLAETVKDSAQQIWLAGLGAFSKAQEEGVKVFEALVKEGKGLEAKTRKMTEARVGEVTDQMNKAAQNATSKANAAWDKLEQVFEDRVARSLHRLGVPTNKDIKSLSKQVEELSAAVKALRARKTTAARAPAKKAAAKRKAG
ncbi:MAG: phasin family protein [Betaproteobacteria bacterium]|nr:phasin family protein [Betaproteobacteria bacterium]MBK8738161.1 phasin family protein [Betaproteobacteria bacterium]